MNTTSELMDMQPSKPFLAAVATEKRLKDSGIDLFQDIHVSSAQKEYPKTIPQFYFPRGKPQSVEDERSSRHALLKTVYPLFLRTPTQDETEDNSRHRSSSTQPPSSSESGIKQLSSQASLPSMTVSNGHPSVGNVSAFMSPQGKHHELDVYKMAEKEFAQVTKMVKVPRYLNRALFRKVYLYDSPVDGTEVDWSKARVTFRQFAKCWKQLSQENHDMNSLSFAIACGKGRSHVTIQDLYVIIEDALQSHPGLVFLASMPVFQQRYIETVAIRLLIHKPRGGLFNRLNLTEWRKMGMLQMLQTMETVTDINQARDAFSYKHFYVIYCKFWELDHDHDMLLSAENLYQYEQGSLLWRVIDRCVEGAGLSSHAFGKPVAKKEEQGMDTIMSESAPIQESRKMTYQEFVHFLIAVEDKSLPFSLEYWFRILDMDADGVISLYELQWFWEEHLDRADPTRGTEFVKFNDFVCSIMDVVQPKHGNMIKLADLKACKHSALVLDMIFDLGKHEWRMRRMDPLSRELDQVWVMDASFQRVKLEGWEKFAERMYELLAQEESEQQEQNKQELQRQYMEEKQRILSRALAMDDDDDDDDDDEVIERMLTRRDFAEIVVEVEGEQNRGPRLREKRMMSTSLLSTVHETNEDSDDEVQVRENCRIIMGRLNSSNKSDDEQDMDWETVDHVYWMARNHASMEELEPSE